MKSKVISLAPLKGGSSKTSTTINLLGAYASNKKKCLAIGLDAQRNLSNFLQKEEGDNELTIYDVLIDKRDIKSAIKESRFKNISYIPDSKRLGERGVHVDKLALKEAVSSIYGEFDYIIIDNPPVLGSGAISSFVSASSVVITAELDKFSLENIVDMINNIVDANDKSDIYITPSKAVTNSKVHRELRRELENFTEDVDYLHLTDSIPYSIEMTNRIYNGQILVNHKAISKSHRNLKKALETLAKELS
ncbi:ParA family protein [Staphylococcus cohnii]|uniref:ParA family protein n=1 Tax=Staphylococcus cohnii TaxID=29382 RepID=UPI003D7EA8CF